MLPWKSIIKVEKSKARAVYLQIADSIISEITLGRVQKGHKMPGSRVLAEELLLNRKTILQAYDELMAQGWMEIVPAKGTFIKQSLPEVKSNKLGRVNRIPPKPVAPFSQKYEQIRGEYVIDDGTPDYRLAPVDLLLKTARAVAKGPIGKSILLGNHFFGESNLREQLAKYLSNTRGIACQMDNTLITRGSQMALYLIFSQLLSKNDKVLVGELNYQSADKIIASVGAKTRKVQLTDEGLDLDHLESILKKEKMAACYVTPHHHYPTTVTMPVENRMRLLELSNTYNFYIIEDDYDYDYHYTRSPILPLASIDHEGRVIYIGSFSKILVPSIRLGYMCASPSIIQSCGSLRMMIDKLGDPIMERALAVLMKENEIERYLKKAVFAYQARRDLFCKLLKDQLQDEINFHIPNGGMAVWATFKNVETSAVMERAAKNKLILKIDLYAHAKKSCRLGFASMSEREIKVNTDIFTQSVLELLNLKR